MATRAEDITQTSTIQLADATYDLLLLTCMEGSRRKVAGVVALAANTGDPADLERFQLLPAVAAQLLDGASGEH